MSSCLFTLKLRSSWETEEGPSPSTTGEAAATSLHSLISLIEEHVTVAFIRGLIQYPFTVHPTIFFLAYRVMDYKVAMHMDKKLSTRRKILLSFQLIKYRIFLPMLSFIFFRKKCSGFNKSLFSTVGKFLEVCTFTQSL